MRDYNDLFKKACMTERAFFIRKESDLQKIKSFRHLAASLRLFSAKSTTSYGGGSVEYGIHFPPVLRKIARKSTAICRQTPHSKKTLIQANRCSRFYVKTVILHFGEQNGARTAHSPAIAPSAFRAIQRKIVCKSAPNTLFTEPKYIVNCILL